MINWYDLREWDESEIASAELSYSVELIGEDDSDSERYMFLLNWRLERDEDGRYQHDFKCNSRDRVLVRRVK